MDISSDSALIATGSADRNIKIWGLDFGDCHKSMFAHDDSVTGLSFVPDTHYFFSSGKDGKIKQWDADIFQKIVTLQVIHFRSAFYKNAYQSSITMRNFCRVTQEKVGIVAFRQMGLLSHLAAPIG